MKYNDNGEWKDIQVKVANAIQNEYGESNNDGYSKNYLNDKVVNVGTEVDSRSRVNFLHSKNLVENILETQTKNGVTFTKNNNGSITLSGTATTNFTMLINTINLKAGKTYTISGGSSISANVRLDMRTSLDGSLYENNWYLPNIATKTINSDITLFFSLRIASGTNTSGITIYPMINEGSTALPYEPYITPSINVDGENIYSKPTVLWQNPSPTSDFASQTITLNDSLANYSFYEVIYKTYKDESIGLNSGKIPTSMGTTLFGGFNAADGGVRNRNRPIVIASNTTMDIGNTNAINTSTNTYTATENGRLIPYQILGYGKKATSSSQTRSLQTINIPENDGEGEIVRGEET